MNFLKFILKKKSVLICVFQREKERERKGEGGREERSKSTCIFKAYCIYPEKIAYLRFLVVHVQYLKEYGVGLESESIFAKHYPFSSCQSYFITAFAATKLYNHVYSLSRTSLLKVNTTFFSQNHTSYLKLRTPD